MAFQHAIAGGNGNLVVQQLQSPNYDPALNQGWQINKDGSATFYAINIPGVAQGAKVTFSSTEPPSPNKGDLWYNVSNGLELSQWDGTTWTPYQIGTGAIANGAITNSLLAALAVATSNIQDFAITAQQVADLSITVQKMDSPTHLIF
jgi:hypothetical protein